MFVIWSTTNWQFPWHNNKYNGRKGRGEWERESVLERESKELEKSSRRRRMRTNALIIQQIKLRKHKEEEGIKRPLALTYKSHVSVDMYPCLYVCICICVCKCIYRCSSPVRDTIFMNDIEHTQTHTRSHTPTATTFVVKEQIKCSS